MTSAYQVGAEVRDDRRGSPRAQHETVRPVAAVHRICAGAAPDHVVEAAAEYILDALERVRSLANRCAGRQVDYNRCAARKEGPVDSDAAIQRVIASTAKQDVVPVFAVKPVMTVTAVNRIGAAARVDDVVAAPRIDRFIHVADTDDRVCRVVSSNCRHAEIPLA